VLASLCCLELEATELVLESMAMQKRWACGIPPLLELGE